MLSMNLSVQDRIIHAVRKSIYSGQLRPGDPLLEMHLARQHGVSQTTVREALAKLEHSGMVQRVRNRGTFVTKLSIQELREYFRLRVVLEGLAAVDAAPRMNSKDFSELRARLDRHSKAAARNAYFDASQYDLEFHRLIWEFACDRTLYRTLDQIAAPMFAYISFRRSSGREDLQRVLYGHEPIWAAMKSGVPDAIRSAVRSHIESSYGQYMRGGVEL
jgi:DNA-binding GntR family transcriptional regulator